MPRRKCSIKKTRVDKKRHLKNLKIKQQLKKTIKNYLAMLQDKKTEDTNSALQKVYSQLDKAAKKGIIHSKTASRKKSRLAIRLGKSA